MSQGFSLIEMLLSIAIFAILGGLSLPLFTSFEVRTDLNTTTQSLTQALRRAQTYARASSGDSSWGTAVQGGVITVFKGASYASRDTNFDETVTIPDSTSTSGLSEVVFTKFTANPSTTGNIALTAGGNTKTVSVNPKGMISDVDGSISF